MQKEVLWQVQKEGQKGVQRLPEALIDLLVVLKGKQLPSVQ